MNKKTAYKSPTLEITRFEGDVYMDVIRMSGDDFFGEDLWGTYNDGTIDFYNTIQKY